MTNDKTRAAPDWEARKYKTARLVLPYFLKMAAMENNGYLVTSDIQNAVNNAAEVAETLVRRLEKGGTR